MTSYDFPKLIKPRLSYHAKWLLSADGSFKNVIERRKVIKSCIRMSNNFLALWIINSKGIKIQNLRYAVRCGDVKYVSFVLQNYSLFDTAVNLTSEATVLKNETTRLQKRYSLLRAIHEALIVDNVEILRFLNELYPDIIQNWGSILNLWRKETGKHRHFSIGEAIWSNSINCVKYLHQIGVDFGKFAIGETMNKKNDSFLMVKFLLSVGYELIIYDIKAAIYCGKYDIAVYLYNLNSKEMDKINENLTKTHEERGLIALSGDLRCLKFGREVLKWADPKDIMVAAFTGSIECVKYCLDNGYELNEEVMWNAVFSGNVKLVKFLLDSGCPMCWGAYSAGWKHVEMLQYLYDTGYYNEQIGYTDDNYQTVDEDNNYPTLDCLRWFRKHKVIINRSLIPLLIHKGKKRELYYLSKNNMVDIDQALKELVNRKIKYDERSTIVEYFERKGWKLVPNE